MLTRLDNEIIVLKINDYLEMNLKDVMILIRELKAFSKKRFKLLVDLDKGYINLSEDAVEFLSHHSIHTQIEKMGIVLKSLPNRIIWRFFARKHKFHYPVQIFEEKEEAVNWLKDFKMA